MLKQETTEDISKYISCNTSPLLHGCPEPELAM